MTRLALNLLGDFQALLDGVPISGFDGDKTRALLAYLAIESGRVHRRETLAALLWPNVLESSARQSLSQALSNARRVLGNASAAEPFILSDRDTVQFNRQSDYELDTERLLATESGTIQSRLALYRGPLLHGFSVADAEGFEEWVLLHRESLQRRVVELFDEAVHEELERGHYKQAIDTAHRQLELDPWREDTHGNLMRAYALNSQRSDALAQYERCKKVLNDALGITPSAETNALLEQIKSGALSPDRAAQSSPAPSQTLPDTLPKALTPFVGRERELGELATLLANPEARLITLVGMGGMGKTRLAIEAASRVRGDFASGAAFVSLVGVHHAASLPQAIGSALGFAAFGASEPAAQLHSFLRDRHMLLVLDNIEHLLSDGMTLNMLADMLRVAPRLTLLITSRETLDWPGEWVFDVHGLGNDAEALFVQSARRIRADIHDLNTEPERATIRQICQLVNGMPLGVEMAASWLRVLSCEEIAAEITRNIGFLANNARNVPERHRSIAAVFEHSWTLLSPQEQHALSHLALFSGGFTREAAQAVAGASLSLLSALIGKSLVRRVNAARFDLHELIRQFASERIESRMSAENAFTNYFVSLAQARSYIALPKQHHTQLAELGRERANIEVAFDYLLKHNAGERAAHLLGSLLTLWLSQQPISRFGLPLLIQLRAWMAGHTAQPTRLAHVQLLSAQLSLQALSIDPSELVDRLTNALAELRRDLSDAANDSARHTLAYGLVILAWVHIRQGRMAEAEMKLNECLPIFRQRGDSFGQAWSLRAMSLVRLAHQQFDEGLAAITECVNISRTLQDPHALGLALGGLGELERALGQLPAAVEHFAESTRLLEQQGDTIELFFGQMNHCSAYTVLGNRPQVRVLLQKLLDLMDRNDGPPSGHARAYLLLTLAGTELLLHDDAVLSAQLLAASLAVLTQLGSSYQPPDRTAFEHIRAQLKSRLSSDEFAAQWHAGETADAESLLLSALARVRLMTGL